MLLLPLVNLNRLWHIVRRHVLRPTTTAGAGGGHGSGGGLVDDRERDRVLVCAFCAAPAIVPQRVASCAHAFCYFCLHSALAGNAQLECPACDRLIRDVVFA